MESEARGTGGMRAHVPWVLSLVAFPYVFYFPIFGRDTIGPEFPFFFRYSSGMNLRRLLQSYGEFHALWYRPTSFFLPYVVGQMFFSWHDRVPWKAMQVGTISLMALSLYALGLVLVPGDRMGAAAGALFAAVHPSLFWLTLEVAPFDFLYVIFAAATTACFLRATASPGRVGRAGAALSGFAFLGAITSKELSVAIPGFLLLATIFVTTSEEGPPPFFRRWLPRAALLVPGFALVAIFARLRLGTVRKEFAANAIYRIRPDGKAMLSNAVHLPLWIARIFPAGGPDPAHATRLNMVVGCVVLLATAAAWAALPALRGRRFALSLLLAWIGVFLAIPIYSGGSLWHVILPMSGYGLLVGFAFSAATARLRPGRRAGVVVLALASLVALGEVGLHAEMDRGSHALSYRLINRNLLEHPPVPNDLLGRSPLIYVEDRLGVGPWWYGCYRFLFDYVYERRDIEQEVVPSIDGVPEPLRARWSEQPNAFFFRYDAAFRWYDDSARFREIVSLSRGTKP